MPDVSNESGEVDDTDRIDSLAAHLTELAETMDDGVPVKGYYLWSLLDDFEWAPGYGTQFGIIRIDPETLQRTRQASARRYAQVARTGAVDTASRRHRPS